MKKLFLLLLSSQLAILAMEQPPAAAGSKKRPAAAEQSEEIEELKEAEKAAPAKQARTVKKMYTLKIPLPGTSVYVKEQINTEAIEDIIAFASIAELINEAQKNGRLFILARVPTSSQGKKLVEYYEAGNIHKALFGNIAQPQNINAVSRYSVTTPKKAPIAGEIYYFLYIPQNDTFSYLGTDLEWFTEPGIIGKKLYLDGLDANNNKDYKRADLLLNTAFQEFKYDLAGLSLGWSFHKIIAKASQENPHLNGKPELRTNVNNFISAINNKPIDFLLTVFSKEVAKQTKINNMKNFLNDILKLNITNEQKTIVQQQLVKLQEPAQ